MSYLLVSAIKKTCHMKINHKLTKWNNKKPRTNIGSVLNQIQTSVIKKRMWF